MSGSTYNIEYIDSGRKNVSSEEAAGGIVGAVANVFSNHQNSKKVKKEAAAQQALLDQLRAQDQTVYNQRLGIAGQISNAAERMDPDYIARLRMNDIAGMETAAANQTKRDIAIRDGGIDTGQENAYDRNSALTIAKDRALAFGKGFADAQTAQNAARYEAAGLLQPNAAAFSNIQDRNNIGTARVQALNAYNTSNWGGFADALTFKLPKPSTSPDPSAGAASGGTDSGGALASVLGSVLGI